MIDFTLLFVSMALFSVGALLDDYTTYIFTRELGVEFEANKLTRYIIKKHGYKGLFITEAIFASIIGTIDSFRWLYSPFIFFGLIFLIVRGLTATDNFQKIVEYRTIGIDAYEEQTKSRRQALQNTSMMNMIKYILPYLTGTVICFVIYLMLLTVDFPFVILSRYFVLALVYYFILKAFYAFNQELIIA